MGLDMFLESIELDYKNYNYDDLLTLCLILSGVGYENFLHYSGAKKFILRYNELKEIKLDFNKIKEFIQANFKVTVDKNFDEIMYGFIDANVLNPIVPNPRNIEFAKKDLGKFIKSQYNIRLTNKSIMYFALFHVIYSIVEDLNEKYGDFIRAHGDLDKILSSKMHQECYWRKHSDLNGYFSRLAYKRYGNRIDEFNCVYLPITKEDVDTIIKMHERHFETGNEFEKSTGFFWGESNVFDWSQSYNNFKELRENFDFDNRLLLYYCWY